MQAEENYFEKETKDQSWYNEEKERENKGNTRYKCQKIIDAWVSKFGANLEF